MELEFTHFNMVLSVLVMIFNSFSLIESNRDFEKEPVKCSLILNWSLYVKQSDILNRGKALFPRRNISSVKYLILSKKEITYK